MALATVLFVKHSAEDSASGDPVRGEMIYRDCMICHSLDQSGTRSKHRGGRISCSVDGFIWSYAG
jgi:cytochrome c2